MRPESSGFAGAGWHLRAVAGPSSFLLPDPEHSAVARSFLVAGYIAAALLWMRASRRARLAPGGRFSGWWLLGAVLLFLLAINKLFNLRLQIEAGFRALAKAEHWYDRRQSMQFLLAVVLPSVLAIVTGIFLATKARVFVSCHRLALAGWLLLLLYLALRQTQEWKRMLPWLEALRYHDWRLALEVAGIALVALAALVEHPLRNETP